MQVKKQFSTKNFDIYSANTNTKLSLPYYEGGISAGFPSPAEDYMLDTIDLNKVLIKNPESTFFARAKGDCLINNGINDGDLLIIDRSLEIADGKIVVSYIDNDFTLKRLRILKDGIWLYPANSEFNPIKVTEENDFMVWGRLTYFVKEAK